MDTFSSVHYHLVLPLPLSFCTEFDNTYEDEVCDLYTNIEETPTGFKLSLDIPNVFFKV